MKMKKIILLSAIITTLCSCKKYEDNPDFYVTINSVTKRLCREWIFEKSDNTNNIILAFSKDYKAEYLFHVQLYIYREFKSNNHKLIYNYTQNATWRFYDKNYILCDWPEHKEYDLEWNNTTNSIDTTFVFIKQKIDTLEILRLTKKEFWYKPKNTVFEQHFKAN